MATENSTRTTPAPQGATTNARARPRKTPSQFPGTVISFNSRPRLVVGDVVELCRGCLPGNQGKLAVVEGFDDEGFVLVHALCQSLDSINLETGEVIFADGPHGRMLPENLYRRSNSFAPGRERRSAP